MQVLPQEHLSKAFKDRVADFESTCGFFTLYGALDTPIEEGADVSLVHANGGVWSSQCTVILGSGATA